MFNYILILGMYACGMSLYTIYTCVARGSNVKRIACIDHYIMLCKHVPHERGVRNSSTNDSLQFT